jgi:hypothetical protein
MISGERERVADGHTAIADFRSHRLLSAQREVP